MKCPLCKQPIYFFLIFYFYFKSVFSFQLLSEKSHSKQPGFIGHPKFGFTKQYSNFGPCLLRHQIILIGSFLEITSNIPKRRLPSKSSCLGINFSSLAGVRAQVAPVCRTHSCGCCDCILCNHRKRTKLIGCRCLLSNSVTHFAHSAFLLRKTVTVLSYHRSSFCHTVLGA